MVDARSALFDLYGDHLRSRGAQAPVAALVRLLASLGIAAPESRITLLPPLDWVAETMRGFPPVTIGRFFIHGSHYETRPPKKKWSP